MDAPVAHVAEFHLVPDVVTATVIDRDDVMPGHAAIATEAGEAPVERVRPRLKRASNVFRTPAWRGRHRNDGDLQEQRETVSALTTRRPEVVHDLLLGEGGPVHLWRRRGDRCLEEGAHLRRASER